MQQKKIKAELIRKKKFRADFFLNSTFCLNFLGKFWCNFCYFNIFPRFSIIFRVCMNFSGIVGAVWIFLWILDLIICLHFYALFGDRKNSRKIIFMSFVIVWILWIFSFNFRSLNFCFNFILRLREFRCSFISYFLLVSLCLCFWFLFCLFSVLIVFLVLSFILLFCDWPKKNKNLKK